jgi:hypothetical protein
MRATVQVSNVAPAVLQDAQRRRMVALLQALALEEGYNLTALPDVRILRSDRPLVRTPVLYDPGIVIVCQGRKRGYFGHQVYLYDEQHYLAVAVPVPFTMESEATLERPLLAIYKHLDFQMAAELMLQIEHHEAQAPEHIPRSMMSSLMNPDLRISAALSRSNESTTRRCDPWPGIVEGALLPRAHRRARQCDAFCLGDAGAVREDREGTSLYPCDLRAAA